jgi:hypothetical protein
MSNITHHYWHSSVQAEIYGHLGIKTSRIKAWTPRRNDEAVEYHLRHHECFHFRWVGGRPVDLCVHVNVRALVEGLENVSIHGAVSLGRNNEIVKGIQVACRQFVEEKISAEERLIKEHFDPNPERRWYGQVLDGIQGTIVAGREVRLYWSKSSGMRM